MNESDQTEAFKLYGGLLTRHKDALRVFACYLLCQYLTDVVVFLERIKRAFIAEQPGSRAEINKRSNCGSFLP